MAKRCSHPYPGPLPLLFLSPPRLHLGWLASLLAWEPLSHESHLLRLILAGPQLRLQHTGHVSPSGASSSDSLTDHHPHCVTPPAAFDIQRLTWALRKLSALTLQAEGKTEASSQTCRPACIFCRQRSVSTLASHSL